MRIDDSQLQWGQVKLLVALGDPGHGLSVGELASKALTNTDRLDRWLNDLVARGLAVWVDGRAGDRRRVAATANGSALAKEHTSALLRSLRTPSFPPLVRTSPDAVTRGFLSSLREGLALPFGVLGKSEGVLGLYGQRLGALFAESQREAQELEAIDGPARWISSLQAHDWRILQRLAQAGREDEAAAQLVAAASEAEFLQALAQQATATPWIAGSAPVIEEALRAHGEERYALSIPALMPQIEGSIRRLSVERGVADLVEAGLDPCQNAGYKSVKCLISRLKAKGEVLFTFFAAYLAESFFGTRNEVLHGNNPRYASAELSTECVFAVHELCYGVRDISAD